MLGSRKTMNELREEYTGITIKALDQNVEARPTLTTRRTGLQWLKRSIRAKKKNKGVMHTMRTQLGGMGFHPFEERNKHKMLLVCFVLVDDSASTVHVSTNVWSDTGFPPGSFVWFWLILLSVGPSLIGMISTV